MHRRALSPSAIEISNFKIEAPCSIEPDEIRETILAIEIDKKHRINLSGLSVSDIDSRWLRWIVY